MTDDFDPATGQPRRRRGAIVALLGALVVLIGGYVGVAAYASGRAPSGTEVGGVQVGGREPRLGVGEGEALQGRHGGRGAGALGEVPRATAPQQDQERQQGEEQAQPAPAGGC